MTQIRQRAVLEFVLLQTLAEHSKGLSPAQAYDLIEPQHEFPEEWYREIPKGNSHTLLQQMGYPDWRDLPQERLIELVKTEPQWQNELRWARNELRKKGQLDASVRNLWRLTPAGLAAAKRSDLKELEPAERVIATPKENPRKRPLAVGEPDASAGSVRESLLRKLNLLIESMPIGDLDLLVDLARAVRMRSLAEDR